MEPYIAQLFAEARAWQAEDPDPGTQQELLDLLEAQDVPAIQSRFAERLEFGTAGIRGVLGSGPGRMNRALVRRVTAGLGRTVLELVPNAAQRGISIAFDGRRLSREMAQDAASVLAGLDIRVHWVGGPLPTPLLAYSVLKLGAAAGIMITASHNPPEYNGYKVYWDNGAQIVPPLDSQISEAISAIGALTEVPWREEAEAREKGLLHTAPADLQDQYLASLDQQALAPPLAPEIARNLRIVYTPLHGVGRDLCLQALHRRGLHQIEVVAQQAEPDGLFPTTRFPNPEEAGALDLALDLAKTTDAHLILANDPDADRLAVVVRAATGEWRQLSGDELGAVLAYHILETRQRCGALPTRGFVVTTVVSSGLLSQMAQDYGLTCERTLTGFKWICNRSIHLERQGGTFLFGYEEALGYLVGRAVRDKDGIGAAALLAESAGLAAAEGKTLLDRLEEIAKRFGYFATRPINLLLPGAEGQQKIRSILEKVRTSPPNDLAGHRLLVFSDLQSGLILDRTTGRSRPSTLPTSDVLQLDLEHSARVTIRPSGTEPKLKLYLEVREPAGPDEPIAEVKKRALEALDKLEGAVRAIL